MAIHSAARLSDAEKKMTTKQPTKALAKKPYTQPKVTTLGDVRTLTQAGTMGGAEDMGMGMGMTGSAFMA
jgi:hypothetical protein